MQLVPLQQEQPQPAAEEVEYEIEYEFEIPDFEDTPETNPDHPDNWKATTVKETGKTYYYNKVTKKTTWTKPEGFLTEEEKAAPVSSYEFLSTGE